MVARTRVIFNGVDPQVFFPREELRESKTIFFVGRFDREKGALELVRAFAQVLGDHADAKLIIGGATGFGTHDETPYVREVRSEALRLESQHPGCVEFPGYIHHDKELPGYFQRATIFTSPSLFQEPFGLVNAEAMACGTPVIAFGCGSVPEVIQDGVTGFVVDSFDEALRAIDRVKTIERQRVRTTFERRFTARRMAEDYVRIYQNVIATLEEGTRACRQHKRIHFDFGHCQQSGI